MVLVLKTVATLFCLALPSIAQDRIYLEGPKEATDEQLAKAVKALSARYQAFDLGKTVKLDFEVVDRNKRKQIKVEAPVELPRSIRNTILVLAPVPAQRVELKLYHKLTEAEAQEFKPGDTPKESKAPKGSTWHCRRGVDFKLARGALLLRDDPIIPMKDLSPLRNEQYYEISAESTKKLDGVLKYPAKGPAYRPGEPLDDAKLAPLYWEGIYSVIDDQVIGEAGKILHSTLAGGPMGKAFYYFAPTNTPRLMDARIRNPLPFELVPTEWQARFLSLSCQLRRHGMAGSTAQRFSSA